MEKPRLEVVVVSEEGPVCLKRLLPDLEEEQPGIKRPRLSSPVYHMEWEVSPQLDWGFLASSLACPPVWPLSTQLQKKTPTAEKTCRKQLQKKPPTAEKTCRKQLQKKPYDPNDFTSDELDPAFEWPRESPPARKASSSSAKFSHRPVPPRVSVRAEVPLLQSILGQFPLGLRLDKLVTLMWKEHKVHLWRLSAERGYGDILRFLEEVPRVRLSMNKGRSRYLVHMV